MLCRRGANLAAEERGVAKWRGRGLGQRNTKSFFLAYKKMSARIRYGLEKSNSSAA